MLCENGQYIIASCLNRYYMREMIRLRKKENKQYIVEREFLSKLSIEELLVRIIKSHMNIETLAKGE